VKISFLTLILVVFSASCLAILANEHNHKNQIVMSGYKTILLLFLLLSLPVLPNQGKYHGDEKFYTDAAFWMIRTGDYLTPYSPTGDLRFNKPILNYWLVAASYRLFGIHQWSARIAQLFCAVGVLWVTYLIGATLKDSKTGLLAMVIYMSSRQFLELSLRSMTDMPLAFWIALSALGFVRQFFLGQRHWSNLALFYSGGALAIATKGGFGIWFILYALAYALLYSPKQDRFKQFAAIFGHRTVLFCSIGLASFWYVAVWLKYGNMALWLFFDDQVGERFVEYKTAFGTQVVSNALAYLAGWAGEFAFWLLVLAIGFVTQRATMQSCLRANRDFIRFAAGWLVALVFPLLFANRGNLRWLFPGYLLTALMFAVILREFFKQVDPAWLHKLVDALIIGFSTVALLLYVLAFGLVWRVCLGAALMVAICGVTLRLLRRADSCMRLIVLAVLILAIVRMNDIIVLPSFFQPPAPALTQFLREHTRHSPRQIAFVSKTRWARFSSLLRMTGGGDWDVTLITQPTAFETVKSYDVIIRHSSQILAGDRTGYISTTGVFGYWNWKAKHLLSLFLRQRPLADIFNAPEHRLEFEVLINQALWRNEPRNQRLE